MIKVDKKGMTIAGDAETIMSEICFVMEEFLNNAYEGIGQEGVDEFASMLSGGFAMVMHMVEKKNKIKINLLDSEEIVKKLKMEALNRERDE